MFVKISPFLLIALATLILWSCEHEPLPPRVPLNPSQPVDTSGSEEIVCDPDTIYFKQIILPLLNSNCSVIGCHDPITAQNDIILSDYQNIMSTAEVVPFQPEESNIIQVLFLTDPEESMPPPDNTPLTIAQKNLLIEWINQGALNNSCEPTACDTTDVSFTQNIFPIISGNCTGCHSGTDPSGGISLTDYTEIRNQSLNGELLNAIKWNGLAENMPKNSDQLSDCKIDIIEAWINNGAPNN